MTQKERYIFETMTKLQYAKQFEITDGKKNIAVGMRTQEARKEPEFQCCVRRHAGNVENFFPRTNAKMMTPSFLIIRSSEHANRLHRNSGYVKEECIWEDASPTDVAPRARNFFE